MYMRNAKVTVLMPVRNGEKYIKEAINSVLNQTFEDFEFLIIDDGSTDQTVDIVQSYTDERIRLEKRTHNFIANLNEGLMLSSGSYIARMDADDIMHTERLRIQFKRMELNPELTVCGTWVKVFNDNGTENNFIKGGHNMINNPIIELLHHNMLVHPSVMIRKDFIIRNNIRYQNYPYVEDYKLWFDIARAEGTLFIEPQELLFFRKNDLQVTINYKEQMRINSIALRKEILLFLLSQYKDNVLSDLYSNFEYLEQKKIVSEEETFNYFVNLFKQLNRIKLNLKNNDAL